MNPKLFILLGIAGLSTPHTWGNDFSEIVKGRISSGEWAEVVAEDLCRAFPSRTSEIIVAVGTEYPQGAMRAAVAGARAVPSRALDAAEAVSGLVQPELRDAAMEIVLVEAKR